MLHDLRLALRWLSGRPALAAIAVVSLALGIGANAAVFSLVDALLLRPFPVPRNDELVSITSQQEGESDGLSVPDYRDLRDGQEVLTGMAAEAPYAFSVKIGEATERLQGELVSSNYFDVLGVSPRLGRDFLEEEETVPTAIAIVSDRLWQRRLGSDRAAVGKTIRVNGQDLTVVGVAPRGFRGMAIAPAMDLWVPLSMAKELFPSFASGFDSRDQPGVASFGRLQEGVSLEQADAALQAQARALELQYPETNRGRTARVVPFGETRVTDRGSVVSYLGILLGVVLSVFAIACVNVAGLRFVDLQMREGEIATRRALGASSGRLARQFLFENLLVYGLAFAASFLVAEVSLHVLERLSLFRFALAEIDLRVDHRVLLAAAGVTLLGAALGSLAFVLVSGRYGLPGRSETSSRRGSAVRGGLVAVQVALSCALLVGAALLGRTLQRLYAIDPGFRTDHVLLVSMELWSLESRYDEAGASQFYRDVVERVRAIPSVRSAALSADTPFERFTLISMFAPEERTMESGPDWIQTDADIVTPDYLRTMGLELVRGRDFAETDSESSPGVVLVNETLARTYWPGDDAVGKRIRVRSFRGNPRDFYEVVGVVKDVKYRTLWEEPRTYLYFPLSQRFFRQMNLHVYTASDPMIVLPAVRDVVHEIDPDLPLYDARPIEAERAVLLVRQRSIGALLAISAALALLLAGVGTYGISAQRVTSRIPEVGLRFALGAGRRDITAWVVRFGLTPAVVGIVVGLLVSLQLSRVLASLLIGVELRDTLSFALAAGASFLAALVACWIPARRASRIDPAQALRGE